MQVVVGEGTIEQTPKGRVRHYRGKQELIRNKAWRIKQSALTAPADRPDIPKFAVEIFENGAWVSVIVD